MLRALYSATEYSSSNYDENEFNLTVKLLYANIVADDKDLDTNDNQYTSLRLLYNF